MLSERDIRTIHIQTLLVFPSVRIFITWNGNSKTKTVSGLFVLNKERAKQNCERFENLQQNMKSLKR